MTQTVLVETRGNVGIISLNRPEKLNALTPEMYTVIGEALEEFDRDPKVRAILLQGNGRSFSAGYDLSLDGEGTDAAEARRDLVIRNANANRWKVWRSRKPVVAKVQGYCLGGALELVLPTDFTIASTDAQVGEPEINLGGSVVFMMVPWLVGQKAAKDILLTGRRYSASEAVQCGLLTQAVPADQLDDTVDALLETLCAIPPRVMEMTKAGVNRAYEARGMVPAIDAWAESSMYLTAIGPGEV